MIIDTHTHFLDGNWLGVPAFELSIEKMIQTQDKYDISEFWISSCGALAEDFCKYNKEMYERTKIYPDRFRNFATASLYYGDKALKNIERCIVDYGFFGIKVHYWMQGGSVHMPESHKLMELSIKHKVPVLFHDGTPPTSDTLQISYLADLYPEAKIILGHSGMFDTPKSAIEACNSHENIYLCISCSTLQGAEMIFKNARGDRLLFGSDYGAAETEDIFTDRRDIIEISCQNEDLKRKIFSENAKALIKDLE